MSLTLLLSLDNLCKFFYNITCFFLNPWISETSSYSMVLCSTYSFKFQPALWFCYHSVALCFGEFVKLIYDVHIICLCCDEAL